MSNTFLKTFEELGFRWILNDNYRVRYHDDIPYIETCLSDGTLSMSSKDLRSIVLGAILRIRSSMMNPQILLCVETMGIPLGSMIAYEGSYEFRIARKKILSETSNYEKFFDHDQTVKSTRFMIPRLSSDRRILIIDDVLSTGQTMRELIQTLRENNMNPVGILTLFRFKNSSTQSSSDKRKNSDEDLGVPVISLWTLDPKKNDFVFHEESFI